MPRYKWQSSHEWLRDKVNNLGEDALREYILNLIQFCDGDKIQDAFQSEMESDGFFDDLDDMGGSRDEVNWECEKCNKQQITVFDSDDDCDIPYKCNGCSAIYYSDEIRSLELGENEINS